MIHELQCQQWKTYALQNSDCQLSMIYFMCVTKSKKKINNWVIKMDHIISYNQRENRKGKTLQILFSTKEVFTLRFLLLGLK